MILVLFLVMVTFFLKSIIFFACFLKDSQNLSYNLFRNMRYVYFLYDKMPKFLTLNIDKEHTHLFLLLKNFLACVHIHLFFLTED